MDNGGDSRHHQLTETVYGTEENNMVMSEKVISKKKNPNLVAEKISINNMRNSKEKEGKSYVIVHSKL